MTSSMMPQKEHTEQNVGRKPTVMTAARLEEPIIRSSKTGGSRQTTLSL